MTNNLMITVMISATVVVCYVIGRVHSMRVQRADVMTANMQRLQADEARDANKRAYLLNIRTAWQD